MGNHNLLDLDQDRKIVVKNNQVGIWVGPNSSWDLYDSIWVERFMQTKDDNAEGYENTNAFRNLPQKNDSSNFDPYFAKFTLIHGTADDNVHFQNAAKLSKQLVSLGYQFDNYFYADEQHSINSNADVNKHVYRL